MPSVQTTGKSIFFFFRYDPKEYTANGPDLVTAVFIVLILHNKQMNVHKMFMEKDDLLRCTKHSLGIWVIWRFSQQKAFNR